MNYCICDINKNVSFRCPDSGLQKSISDKLAMFADSHMLANIIINSDDLGHGLASFSYGNQMGNFGIPRIDLGKDDFTYNDNNGELTANDINAAFYLQHELNHFIHMDVDKGKYTHPNLIKYGNYDVQYYFKTGIVSKSRTIVKINEIECGWRCLLDDIKYGVSKEHAFIDRELQLQNIMGYINPFHCEIQRKYYDRLTEDSQKALKKECISKLKLQDLDKYYNPRFSFHWKSYIFK